MANEVIVSENIAGNWHSVRSYCNANGLAPYLLQVSEMTGHYCVVLFRMPEDLALLLTEKRVLRYVKPD